MSGNPSGFDLSFPGGGFSGFGFPAAPFFSGAAMGNSNAGPNQMNPLSPQPTTRFGPFDVPNPITQTFGFDSQFNPLMAFDLMQMGIGPFVSPLVDSGLWGYPRVAQIGGKGLNGRPHRGK